MSDLRNNIIRLAHENPELRKHLLPLVKIALTIGGRKILEKVRTDHYMWPIDRSPFQLSKHPIFKTQMRYYLPFLESNFRAGWKIQPSSIYVEYFIDHRGLVLRINDPNNKLRAKNTESETYWLENDRHIKFNRRNFSNEWF